ncbi:uncharacterized protein [Spinacia oleracea]|uniref:Uncharacterized protein isoform X2 n=1 Tax=Spinacia oleracea TaxID=3562 RepID=A0ABM3R017_SPIOL|nr:uncharacterized protein LOC110777581 isoform X2 [Spinacia oleracea]
MKKLTILPLLIILQLIHPINTTTTTLISSSSSIHDLLKSQGLPGGIFPRNVKSYTLDQDGLLEVYFDEPCESMFETLVRFDTVVKANLTFGGLNGVEGLSQEELFLWLPVKDIIVKDPLSGLILFDIGVAQKQLAFSLFEDPPICNPHRPSFGEPNWSRRTSLWTLLFLEDPYSICGEGTGCL